LWSDFKNSARSGAAQTGYAIGASKTRNSILMLGGEACGTNFNVVPEQCWFTVDRLINPEENFDAEKDRLITLRTVSPRRIRLDWEICKEGRLRRLPATSTSAVRSPRA